MWRPVVSTVQRASTRGFSFASAKTPALTKFIPLQQNIVKQYFSTSPIKFSSVAKELQDVLHEEINAEKTAEEENLGGKATPSVQGFEIGMNDAEFRLTKTYGNEKIVVYCNINHSVEDEEHFEDDNVPSSVADDVEADVPVSLPPFHIEITKGNLRLVFLCQMVKDIEGGYDYSVDEFMIAPATKGDKYVDVPDEVYSSSGQYIDEQLHVLLFVRYLEERGLNSQFCHEFVKLATHYEHQQYVNLLEKLKKFVEQ
uniref:Uncharacterized protein n=3 Tax=Meloidogyne TaxID=189290 RepID=A0A6V7VX95_MELEN|nr:unnamed protein product [Meloidogyne enterolobii]CAD2194768.1 unnamed protein product [Meloidogyne enterolobii]CAD2201401.1 unnamed protein product [Meloidogyne enterolobii]